mmetsp:Transcript_8386/g.20723  ORF Transcript_8386/g.20723 Transcript_8386/m.20723 type:complete len:453 (-) Transcript_8386:190-1548(-)
MTFTRLISRALQFLAVIPLLLSHSATGATWGNHHHQYRPSDVVAFVGPAGGGAHSSRRNARNEAFASRVSDSAAKEESSVDEAEAEAETTPAQDLVRGPVLHPSSSDTAFDSACVANPVVLPPSATRSGKWQMYYYGNPGSWANDTKGFLPTGYVGLAESTDGIHWEKIPGTEAYGSVLAPTGRDEDFDGLHLGVGDVVRISDDELHMYYFGGSFEGTPKGMRMRIGKARSTDGGRSWERLGQVLDYDPREGLFASWPRIVLPEDDNNDNDGQQPWRMLYHAFNGTTWTAYEATSSDKGETWTRGDGNKAIGPGDPEGWDGCGVGTRALVRTCDGQLVMVYEAVAGEGGAYLGKHRLGLARWEEEENGGGGVWVKDTAITGIPGGPILDGGVAPMEPWTSRVIGTPYLVAGEDGSMRLYYCSTKDNDMPLSIGLLESASGEFDPSSWKSISP